MRTRRRIDTAICVAFIFALAGFFTVLASGQLETSAKPIPLFVAEAKRVEIGTVVAVHQYPDADIAFVEVAFQDTPATAHRDGLSCRGGVIMGRQMALKLVVGQEILLRTVTHLGHHNMRIQSVFGVLEKPSQPKTTQ